MRYIIILGVLALSGCSASPEVRAYLSAECVKDGYTVDTDAHLGCMKVKYRAAEGGGGAVLNQQHYGKPQTICRQSGTSTVCY